MPLAPDLPTVAEAGVPGYEASFGELLLVRREVSRKTIDTLNRELTAILSRVDVRERMAASDLEFVPNAPDEAARRVQREAAKWTSVVERLDLRVD